MSDGAWSWQHTTHAAAIRLVCEMDTGEREEEPREKVDAHAICGHARACHHVFDPRFKMRTCTAYPYHTHSKVHIYLICNVVTANRPTANTR